MPKTPALEFLSSYINHISSLWSFAYLTFHNLQKSGTIFDVRDISCVNGRCKAVDRSFDLKSHQIICKLEGF